MQSQEQSPLLTIGTRGSPLALAQAELTRSLIAKAHDVNPDKIAIKIVSTAGDRSQAENTSLATIGGKGLFSKEIEDLLLAGKIDLAVHSSKDMATRLPDGLVMPVFLEREDVRDVLIGPNASTISALPQNARIGTSSLRRRAQLLHLRPDLEMLEFRGNVGTRLKKIADGVADVTLLAAAGLKRLGMVELAANTIDPDLCPPAPAQGAIGLEIRANDQRLADLIAPLNHAPTSAAVTAERAMLKVLDGSCRTPIGAYTIHQGDDLIIKGQILGPDGKDCFTASVTGPVTDPIALGEQLGRALIDLAGPEFIAEMNAQS